MNKYNIAFFISDTGSCSCDDPNHNNDHSHEDSSYKIEAKIKSFGAWAQVLPYSFVVKTTLTADKMYNEIKSISNPGDLIFINKIDCSDIAYKHEELLEWINK